MYIFGMNRIASTKARQNWAETIEEAKSEPIMLTDHGRPAVVMMHPELAKLALQVLEDSCDIEQALAASKRIQNGGKTYSLEEVAAELGFNLEEL